MSTSKFNPTPQSDADSSTRQRMGANETLHSHGDIAAANHRKQAQGTSQGEAVRELGHETQPQEGSSIQLQGIESVDAPPLQTPSPEASLEDQGTDRACTSKPLPHPASPMRTRRPKSLKQRTGGNSRIPSVDRRLLVGELKARAFELGASRGGIKAAREMHDVVMAVVCLTTGLRIETISMLTICNVEELDGRLHLCLKADDSPSNTALDLCLTETAASLLRSYLADWRPVLVRDRPKEAALWVRSSGCAMNASMIHRRLRRVVDRIAGRLIPLHMLCSMRRAGRPDRYAN